MRRLGAVIVGVASCAALVLLLLWTSRPVHLDAAATSRRVDTITSLLAEGALQAEIVEHGDGYDRATRVRAAELADALDQEASTLDRAIIDRDARAEADRAVGAAADGSTQLVRLVVDPGDREVAAKVHDELDALSEAAG